MAKAGCPLLLLQHLMDALVVASLWGPLENFTLPYIYSNYITQGRGPSRRKIILIAKETCVRRQLPSARRTAVRRRRVLRDIAAEPCIVFHCDPTLTITSVDVSVFEGTASTVPELPPAAATAVKPAAEHDICDGGATQLSCRCVPERLAPKKNNSAQGFGAPTRIFYRYPWCTDSAAPISAPYRCFPASAYREKLASDELTVH
ncbi:hypothetical protein C8Q79DRAFT_927196 [Trametes meyenii]|nr:hypothetical protein C8Q79DRAFT_927196 [Trametes meyenii]